MTESYQDIFLPRAVVAADGRMRAIAARCESAGLPESGSLPLAPAASAAFAAALAGLSAPPAATVPDAGLSRAVPARLDEMVALAAREHGLDPDLVRAIVSVESGGNPAARSSAGAQGLMQLMPDTARELGVTEPFDPMQNVRGGAAYLRSLLDRFGDTRLAVAAYNAGPAAVERAHGVPPFPETRAYVERVAAELQRLRSAG